jgi:hypothetical protein
MPYKKGDENTFFPTMIAALIVIAIAIAAFIYSFVRTTPDDLMLEPVAVSVSSDSAAPSSVGPSAPPSIPFPTEPPPAD